MYLGRVLKGKMRKLYRGSHNVNIIKLKEPAFFVRRKKTLLNAYSVHVDMFPLELAHQNSRGEVRIMNELVQGPSVCW